MRNTLVAEGSTVNMFSANLSSKSVSEWTDTSETLGENSVH